MLAKYAEQPRLSKADEISARIDARRITAEAFEAEFADLPHDNER